MKMLPQKKKMIILATTLLVAGSLTYAGYRYYRAGTDSLALDDKNKAESTGTPEKAPETTSSAGASVAIDTTEINVQTPVANGSILPSRLFRGTSQNTFGKIYYKLVGEESGVLSEGSVDTNDAGKIAEFSTLLDFQKKPVEGEPGYLELQVKQAGSYKTISKILITI